MKNIFRATSRLIFDQITGHHCLAVLTHKINHGKHSALIWSWYTFYVLNSKFIVLKYLDFTSPWLFNIAVAVTLIVLISFILLFQIIPVVYTSDQALFLNGIILLRLFSFLLIPFTNIYGQVFVCSPLGLLGLTKLVRCF